MTFDTSPWWDSLWLFEKSYTLFLAAFPFSQSNTSMCDRLLQLNISLHLKIYIWRALFSKIIIIIIIKSGKIYRHKSMHVSRSTKPFTNNSWQVWRSIYNNHKDFKISPTVIWVHENKQCSKMHKAISTKVQDKIGRAHVWTPVTS